MLRALSHLYPWLPLTSLNKPSRNGIVANQKIKLRNEGDPPRRIKVSIHGAPPFQLRSKHPEHSGTSRGPALYLGVKETNLKILQSPRHRQITTSVILAEVGVLVPEDFHMVCISPTQATLQYEISMDAYTLADKVLYKAVMKSDPIDEATALAALEDGANANIIEISAGVSALFISTQRGSIRLVQKLLELGARVDLESFTTGESARESENEMYWI